MCVHAFNVVMVRCYKSDINDHFTFLLYCHVFRDLRRGNEVHHAVVKIISIKIAAVTQLGNSKDEIFFINFDLVTLKIKKN